MISKKYKDKDWLYQKYWGEKLSAVKIAELCGISDETIFTWMRKFGILRRTLSEAVKKNGLFENKDWLYQKYLVEELSTIQIAELCKCGKRTISRRMKRFNIKIRTFSEAQNIAKKSRAPRHSEDRPYKHKSWLQQKYLKEKLSLSQIGELCKVDQVTIHNWMKKFGIKIRTLSDANKLNWTQPGMKKRMIEIMKIVQKRPEIKEKKRQSSKERWADPEYKKRMSEIHKVINNLPGSRKRNSRRTKKLWTNPEYVKKVLKANKRRPTNPEKVFDEMTPDIIRYTGNRAWWRQLADGKYRNPDFKITGQNKVIEIFGDYWHKGENPQELIDLYKQAGLDCLVFWEHEVYNNQEQILKKVNQFIDLIGEGSANSLLPKSATRAVPPSHISNKEDIWSKFKLGEQV